MYVHVYLCVLLPLGLPFQCAQKDEISVFAAVTVVATVVLSKKQAYMLR